MRIAGDTPSIRVEIRNPNTKSAAVVAVVEHWRQQTAQPLYLALCNPAGIPQIQGQVSSTGEWNILIDPTKVASVYKDFTVRVYDPATELADVA